MLYSCSMQGGNVPNKRAGWHFEKRAGLQTSVQGGIFVTIK